MVSLINSLDLSSTPREYPPDLPLYSTHTLDLDFRYYSQRSQFGFTTSNYDAFYARSRLLLKSPSSNDDEFYARILWRCGHLECTGVLSPLDRLRNGPKTVAEIYANDVRCCPECGDFREKTNMYIIVDLVTPDFAKWTRNVKRRTKAPDEWDVSQLEEGYQKEHIICRRCSSEGTKYACYQCGDRICQYCVRFLRLPEGSKVPVCYTCVPSRIP